MAICSGAVSAMHNGSKPGDDQKQKTEVLRLFAEGQLDPNVATARLLELDRRRRHGARREPSAGR
jgi:hypothetical protein